MTIFLAVFGAFLALNAAIFLSVAYAFYKWGENQPK